MPAIELTLLTGNEVALWGQSVAEVYVAVQVRNTGAAELRGLAERVDGRPVTWRSP